MTRTAPARVRLLRTAARPTQPFHPVAWIVVAVVALAIAFIVQVIIDSAVATVAVVVAVLAVGLDVASALDRRPPSSASLMTSLDNTLDGRQRVAAA
jgi:hypothetical protein